MVFPELRTGLLPSTNLHNEHLGGSVISGRESTTLEIRTIARPLGVQEGLFVHAAVGVQRSALDRQ